MKKERTPITLRLINLDIKSIEHDISMERLHGGSDSPRLPKLVEILERLKTKKKALLVDDIAPWLDAMKFATNNPTQVSGDDFDTSYGNLVGFCVHCREFTTKNVDSEAGTPENCSKCAGDYVIGAAYAIRTGLITI